MYYSNYTDMNETQVADLINKTENLTNAYRNGSMAAFHYWIEYYHTTYIEWFWNEQLYKKLDPLHDLQIEKTQIEREAEQ